MLRFAHILLCLLAVTSLLSKDEHDDHDDDDGHGDEHEEDKTFEEARKENLVSEIAEHLGVKLHGAELHFEKENIQLLLENLLFRKCEKISVFAKCNLCLSTEDVLKWYNLDGSVEIEEENIQDISVGLVYALSENKDMEGSNKPYSDICRDFKVNLLNLSPSSLPGLIFSKYQTAGEMTEQSLSQMIKDIDKTFGNSLPETCFKTKENEEVFHDVTIKVTDMKEASTFLLTRLLGNGCLKIAKTKTSLIDIGGVIYSLQDLYFKKFTAELTNMGVGQQQCSINTKNDILNRLGVKKEKMIDIHDMEPFGEDLLKMIDCNVGEDHKDVDDHKDHDHDKDNQKKDIEEDTWEPWIATLISVAIMSLISIVGIIAFAGKKMKYFDHFISFLLSLGVSVLLCDAILHLIPHALDLHGHKDDGANGHEEHGHGEDGHEDESPWTADSYIWKCFAVLMGTYLFLVIQLIMSVFGHGHSHGQDEKEHGKSNDQEMVLANNGVVLTNGETGSGESVIPGDDINNLTPNAKFTLKSIKTAAWLILLGDGLHNFMDGIAIGGAFSERFPTGLQGGVMTSIAILIHELPHEFADFAVLIQTGLTVKQALILNLLSSLTAFLGGLIGVALGTKWNATPWILAVTGGLFLYISLATMLPEVLNHPLLKTSKLAVALNILGFIIGFLILLFLAAYEDALKNALA